MKRRYPSHSVRRSAVKESFDNLPSGICFANHNGIVILCNRQMHRLSHILLGQDLQNLGELRHGLEYPQPEVEILDEAQAIYRFPEGQIWQYYESQITDSDGQTYTQIQAVNVTELHEKSRELETENQMLKEAIERARRLYAAIDQTVREKEILALKMKVHDDIGRCLLASRRLMLRESSLEEYRQSGDRWRETLKLIGIADASREPGQPVSAEETLKQLMDTAKEIGVRIVMQGRLPSDEENAYLAVAAMRECATNTVRHAGGNEMTVQLTDTPDADKVIIQNNGKKPEAPIIEGGGLTSLRRSIESAGGCLLICSSPEFKLRITLPKRRRTD